MKKFFIIKKKNKAFILIYTLTFSFFLMALVILTQIVLNSKIENFKFNKIYFDENYKIEFLNSIVKQELKLIENFCKEQDIDNISVLFDTNLKQEKIFLSENYETSIFGYSLMNNNTNINPKEYVEKQIKSSLKDYINLYFQKIIYVDNKRYFIEVSIEYKINRPKNINNLSKGIVKRIWIKEND